MKSWTGLAVLSLSVFVTACSTGPRPTSSGPPSRSTTHPLPPQQAPTGFDGASNGFTDAPVHQTDQAKFDEVEQIPDGLGPIYNAQSCRECHQNPISGGNSQILELRVGHNDRNGRFVFPDIPINDGSEVIKGRTLVNQRAICPNGAFPDTNVQERVPQSENIRTFRISLNLLGVGYVEAVLDSTLIAIANKQCHGDRRICGVALPVPVLESPGETRVGRFGWKDQHASLMSMTADAYLNEMGITNSLQREEVTSLCNTVSEPNDKPGADGLTDLDHFVRFLRATKAPARDARRSTSAAARQGEALFAKIGCSVCHVPTLTTAPAGTAVNGGTFVVPDALGNKIFHPYSDYLLHDIGTGDGIAISMPEHYGRHVYETRWRDLPLDAFQESANRIRTAPLWGLRMRTMLMHDGASVTFRDAIARHGGEATDVTKRFEHLSEADRESILEFLGSL
ncbi:MAG TPA: di-heme oxidoredictase family protein [Steroidobacteraceae bacterium]